MARLGPPHQGARAPRLADQDRLPPSGGTAEHPGSHRARHDRSHLRAEPRHQRPLPDRRSGQASRAAAFGRTWDRGAAGGQVHRRDRPASTASPPTPNSPASPAAPRSPSPADDQTATASTPAATDASTAPSTCSPSSASATTTAPPSTSPNNAPTAKPKREAIRNLKRHLVRRVYQLLHDPNQIPTTICLTQKTHEDRAGSPDRFPPRRSSALGLQLAGAESAAAHSSTATREQRRLTCKPNTRVRGAGLSARLPGLGCHCRAVGATRQWYRADV